MQGADLQGAALFGADLSSADLANANLTGAYYDTTTKWPKDFDPKSRGAILTTVDEWKKSIP